MAVDGQLKINTRRLECSDIFLSFKYKYDIIQISCGDKYDK